MDDVRLETERKIGGAFAERIQKEKLQPEFIELEAIAIGTKVVLEKCEPRPLLTSKGVYLPESSEKKPDEGIIKSIGSEVNLTFGKFHAPLNIGMRVAYSRYAGNEVDLAEHLTVLVVDQLDICCVLREKKSADNDSNVQSSTIAQICENAS